jgi:hypothetical protein
MRAPTLRDVTFMNNINCGYHLRAALIFLRTLHVRSLFEALTIRSAVSIRINTVNTYAGWKYVDKLPFWSVLGF